MRKRHVVLKKLPKRRRKLFLSAIHRTLRWAEESQRVEQELQQADHSRVVQDLQAVRPVRRIQKHRLPKHRLQSPRQQKLHHNPEAPSNL